MVEVELAGVQQREALGERPHHAVLDAVVDHLDVVSGASRPDMQPARPVLFVRRRRECVEDRRNDPDRLVVTADHHAVAVVQTPHAAGRADVDVVDAAGSQRHLAVAVVGPLGVAAVDDDVAGLQQSREFLDRLLRGVAGRNHDPDHPRPVAAQVPDHVLQRERAGGADAHELFHDRLVTVVHDDLVVRLGVDPANHVAAHLAEPYHCEFHDVPSGL